jgi:hypothetical protein
VRALFAAWWYRLFHDPDEGVWAGLRSRIDMEPYDPAFAGVEFDADGDTFGYERSTTFRDRCTCQVCSAGPELIKLRAELLDPGLGR